ncbi:hypothetical protein [Pseudoalteromonas sp. MMG024]|uniref:hypothetical protein n=1 Tax=Pseudoalteromonas sp. MMG024 TaxID=2909980 RepID=UPI001F36B183|nr:hypothetical protein [Pseudoalteromonas sp. MMG024]MCF6459175.1 hypothetical protein [Pseudoalteromonas sp. MMG024]
MSAHIAKLFRMLAKNAETIEAIMSGDASFSTEQSLASFEQLNSYNLAFETASGSIRLSSSFQQFLDMALKTDKNILANIDVGGYWRSIIHNLDQMNQSDARGAYLDSEQYKRAVVDGIYQLIDGVNSNILQLRTRLDNKFGYVNSLSAKRKENEQAIVEAKALREALNIIDAEEIYQRLPNDNKIIRIINIDLIQGKLQAQNELLNALSILQTLLVGFRKLEGRTKLIKEFKTFFDTHSEPNFEDLVPVNEQEHIPQIINFVNPIKDHCLPDDNNVLVQKELIEIIQSIEVDNTQNFKRSREANSELNLDDDNTEIHQEDSQSQIWLQDILIYTVKNNTSVLVSNHYQTANIELDFDIYLDMIYTEWFRIPSSKSKYFEVKPIGEVDEIFNGDFAIEDIEVCYKP